MFCMFGVFWENRSKVVDSEAGVQQANVERMLLPAVFGKILVASARGSSLQRAEWKRWEETR